MANIMIADCDRGSTNRAFFPHIMKCIDVSLVVSMVNHEDSLVRNRSVRVLNNIALDLDVYRKDVIKAGAVDAIFQVTK